MQERLTGNMKWQKGKYREILKWSTQEWKNLIRIDLELNNFELITDFKLN